MNPIISNMFQVIEWIEGQLIDYDSEGFELLSDEEQNSVIMLNASIKHLLLSAKSEINDISETLNPQIPEPYASMSAEDIIKSMGVYG